MAARDYDSIVGGLTPSGSINDRMRAVADALWDGLHDQGVSWVGFYVDRPGEPDDRRLVLGPCRDQLGCSPIGLHGVCGQALRFRISRVVDDVRELGDEYIACDPRDRSEIAIPLLDEQPVCWGVLDLDSWDLRAFDEWDEEGLRRVMRAAGLLPLA